MYPNLYYAFRDLFGFEIPFLKVVNSFGFFVAIAFLLSAWLLIKELRRREALGIFTYTDTTITIGEPAGFGELLINFLLGFCKRNDELQSTCRTYHQTKPKS